MTSIDSFRISRPRLPASYLVLFLALLALLLLGVCLGDQVTVINNQSATIKAQHKLIEDASRVVDHAGYKFATGFLAGCGDPCVIRQNPGGVVNDYEWLASVVNLRNQVVLIDGYCASACALFADRARAHVRITDRAEFLFHKTSDGCDPPHSRDIAAWVNAHGGFPSQASGNLTMMDFDEARRFWQPAFDFERIPFDLDAPRGSVAAYPEVIAGLRGTLQ